MGLAKEKGRRNKEGRGGNERERKRKVQKRMCMRMCALELVNNLDFFHRITNVKKVTVIRTANTKGNFECAAPVPFLLDVKCHICILFLWFCERYKSTL